MRYNVGFLDALADWFVAYDGTQSKTAGKLRGSRNVINGQADELDELRRQIRDLKRIIGEAREVLE